MTAPTGPISPLTNQRCIVGTGNVGWMLALGAVMAVEKNAPWGARLSRPVGAALIAGAGLLAGVNLLA